MEICRNRTQQRLCAKIVIVTIVTVATIWLIFGLRQSRDRVTTCEPTMTVRKMGQFGNQIWEYMSIYVIWLMKYDTLKAYNITPYIEEDMKNNLEDLFENLTIQSLPRIFHFCEEKDTIIVPKNKPFRLPEDISGQNILLDSYSARYEDVVNFGVNNIKKELRFRQNYIDDVMKKLEELRTEANLQNNETVFVGMHYRGGDYIPHLEGHHGDKFKGPPNYSYYIKAMDYFKEKYGNVIFILISIDNNWLADNALKITKHGLVVVNPYTNDRNRDLTLLSHCNHSIISYGTFGVTAALFAEGETILYDLELPIDYRGDTIALGLSKLLPTWMRMKNTRETNFQGHSL